MESNVLLARESIIISITHLILEVLAPPTQSMLACTVLGDTTPEAAAAATVQLVLTSDTTPAAATV
mgnify:CR=1 FL=1